MVSLAVSLRQQQRAQRHDSHLPKACSHNVAQSSLRRAATRAGREMAGAIVLEPVPRRVSQCVFRRGECSGPVESGSSTAFRDRSPKVARPWKVCSGDTGLLRDRFQCAQVLGESKFDADTRDAGRVSAGARRATDGDGRGCRDVLRRGRWSRRDRCGY